MMMAAPTLSVGIPNFNHAEYLAQAVRSVSRQSVRPIEILLLDDASTDESWELITQLAAEDPGIVPMRHSRNLGVIASLNDLLHIARGEFVHFVAADDFLLPGFYEAAMRLLAEFPGAGLCCSRYVKVVDGSPTLLPDTHYLGDTWGHAPRFFTPDDLVALRTAGYIYGNTIVINRAALTVAGGYLPELRWHTDWFANWVVGFRHGICFQPEALAAYRLSAGQYSRGRNRGGADQRDVVRAILLRLQTPAYADVWAAFRDSGILSLLDEIAVAQTVLENPDLLTGDVRQLAWSLLEASTQSPPGAAVPLRGRYSAQYLRQRLCRGIARWKASGARVVVYGAGEHTANLFKWTDLQQANIVGLIDGNPDLTGRVYWSLPVLAPAQLPELKPDVIVLSSMTAYAQMHDTVRTLVSPDVEIVRLYDAGEGDMEAGE
jgi:hypothetical protein